MTEKAEPGFAIEELNKYRTNSSRDVRSRPTTSLAKRSWFFSRKPRASYSTYDHCKHYDCTINVRLENDG